MKPITDFLKNLSSIGITGALGLLALKAVLTEKFGKSINGFINAVIKDMTRERLNAIKTFSQSVNLLAKSLLIITGAIGLLTAEIMFFGPLAVAGSLALMTLFIGTSILMMRMAGKADRDISKGTAAFKDIAKAMTWLSLDVMIVTAAAVILQAVEWESIGKVVVMVGVLTVVTAGIMFMANRWKKGGDNALKTMTAISLVIAAATLSIGMIALMTKIASVDEIVAGTVLMLLTVTAMVGLVHWMSKIKTRNLEKATQALMMITGAFTIVSIVAAVVLPAISKQFVDVLGGLFVTAVIISAMVLTVKWLSSMKTRNLKKAQDALLAITAVFTIVSIVAAVVLPAIGQQMGAAFKGLAVVAVIMLAMVGTVWLVGKLPAKDTRQALVTMIAMTAIVTVISAIALFMLPEIGEHKKEAFEGAKVVGALLVGMIVMTWVLGKMSKTKLT